MELPPGIEKDLVKYLCLELGESPRSKSSVKVGDLGYVGLFEIDGVQTHYWLVSGRRSLWATVEEFEGQPCLGMTSKSPIPIDPIVEYQTLRIKDLSRALDVELPLETDGRGGYFLPDFVEIELPGKENEVVRVLAEAYTSEPTIPVVISVEQGDRGLYVSASRRIQLSYTVDSGRTIYLSVGPDE